MVYILDAYNVIHKIPQLEVALARNLRSGRDALVTLCARFAAGRGDVSEMILVFDGKSEFNDLPQFNPPKIKLVFSETGEDADERIAKLLEHLTKTKQKCVVSDDNFVRNHARAYATSIMSVSQFEQLIHPKPKTRKSGKPSRDEFFLPPKIAQEITEAYKKRLGLS